METKHELPSDGYYVATLSTTNSRRILRSNNERAFIISQLQDLLGRRSLLEEPDVRQRLASHIDLLAFSILGQDIMFVLFSISHQSVATFMQLISNRLKDYQSEWQLAPSFRGTVGNEHVVTISRLSGPYHALNMSISLHLRHPDWEYDRYSSIGFYLHDRRGDWMHLWRTSQLYENNSEVYYQLISKRPTRAKPKRVFSTIQPFEPLSHAL